MHIPHLELELFEQPSVILSGFGRGEIQYDFGVEIPFEKVVEEYKAVFFLDGDKVVFVSVVFGRGWWIMYECELGVDAMGQVLLGFVNVGADFKWRVLFDELTICLVLGGRDAIMLLAGLYIGLIAIIIARRRRVGR